MTSLDDFLVPAEVTVLNPDKTETLRRLPIKAYAVDKTCGSAGKLRNNLGMSKFHCCDYIFSNQNIDFVLIMEDSNLMAKKKQLKQQYPASYINEILLWEVKLKAYGSIALFYRLLLICDHAKQLMDGKELNFWLIVNDAKRHDSTSLYNLKKKLSNLSPIFAKVAVNSLDDAIENLRRYAQSHP